MPKKAWIAALVGCGVLLSGWLALRAQRAEQASALTERSLRLLRAPLSEAASLRDVRAREARELLEEAEALASNETQTDLLVEARSLELFGRGEYARAAQLLADATSSEPHLGLVSAAVALARGNTGAAQAALDQLPATLQEDSRVLLLRSDVARALGRADVALAAAESGIEHSAGSAAAYERRGLAHELLGDRVHAAEDLTRAAQLDRRASSALLALGRMQRGAGQLDAAVLSFQEASERSPNEAEAWLGSGVCRAVLGDRVLARIDLERAAALEPKRAEPLIALADVDVMDKNIAAALRRYRAALLLDPHSALGRVKLGNALLRAGAVPDAIPQFQAAITERPDLAAAHNGLGAAFAAQGELKQAEDELSAAARLDPADAHPWLNLARLYKRRGDTVAVTNALSNARERDPHLALADTSAHDAPAAHKLQ
jgi:tetratricopeptide (TPR) repeat protein